MTKEKKDKKMRRRRMMIIIEMRLSCINCLYQLVKNANLIYDEFQCANIYLI